MKPKVNNTSAKGNTNLVTKAVFSNTQSGSYDSRDNFVGDVDRNGKRLYSTNLKATSEQVERNFPAVLDAGKITAIVAHKEGQGKTLLVESNATYRLKSEPIHFEENEVLGTPARMVAFYRPMIEEEPFTL
tara:strand:+ start:41 stop:433 length:393 start_codon:yes stop_codon:yes gene_type:complete